MNKKYIDKIRKMLIEERDNLVKKNYHEKDSDIDHDGDETDEIQAAMLASIKNKLSSRELMKIKNINLALQKMDDNTFGDCEDCGELIPEKRLLINPCFTTCVACAEDREKMSR